MGCVVGMVETAFQAKSCQTCIVKAALARMHLPKQFRFRRRLGFELVGPNQVIALGGGSSTFPIKTR